jgi:flagellar protein FliL
MTTNATAPTAEAAPEGAPKKSRRGLFTAAAVALVVLLGGGGAYWMYAKGKPAEGEAHAKAEEAEEKEPPAAVELEPFVVNLADPGGSNFLRVNLSLVVHDEEQAKVFEESPVTKMKVRSAVLELLALQSADALITPAGKTALKKAIAEAATKAASEVQITDVLFSEFVVQF